MANTQDVRVTNLPDEAGNGSAQRVAFELMARIENSEHGYGKGSPIANPREYYLALYRECLLATRGRHPTTPPAQ